MYRYDQEKYCIEDEQRHISLCWVRSQISHTTFRLCVDDDCTEFVAESIGDAFGGNVWDVNQDIVRLKGSGVVVDNLVVETLAVWGGAPGGRDLSLPSLWRVSFRGHFQTGV